MDCVNGMDEKFVQYKRYMKGVLSSQALCRISIPELGKDDKDDVYGLEFWRQLGVHDEIDLRYIVGQIERFLYVYSIRVYEDREQFNSCQQSCKASEAISNHQSFANDFHDGHQPNQVNKFETKTDKRLRKRQRQKERQTAIQEQKEAALKRAAELVQSNRVPLELMTGSKSSEKTETNVTASNEPIYNDSGITPKHKSCIIISTARDLERIVTHARNLYSKYNTIARQHNQRVSWSIVSKEIGLHTKVREKYTRMFNRALERGFDFNTCGHYKIRDHPEIFLHPIIKTVSNSQPVECDPSVGVLSDTSLSPLHDPTTTHETKHDMSEQVIDDQVAAAVDAAMQIPVASGHDETLTEALVFQEICSQTEN